MFYLLENNRIVDSENLPHEWKFYTVLISEKDKTIILHCRDPRERKKYKIKNQSENVFDLIEVGDLVRYKTKCLGIEYLYTMEVIEKAFEDYAKRGFYNILAIYKPDAKGNYIKVWEKKDD